MLSFTAWSGRKGEKHDPWVGASRSLASPRHDGTITGMPLDPRQRNKYLLANRKYLLANRKLWP